MRLTASNTTSTSSASGSSNSTSENGSGGAAGPEAAWALTLLAEACYLHWCGGVGRKPAVMSLLTKPRQTAASSAAAAGSGAGRSAVSIDALLGGGEVGWGGRTLVELGALARDLTKAAAASGNSVTASAAAVADEDDGDSKSSPSDDASSAPAAAADSASGSNRDVRDAAKAATAVSRDASLQEDIALHLIAQDALKALQKGAKTPAAAPAPVAADAPASARFPFLSLQAACLAPFNLARLAAQGGAMVATAASSN